MGREYASRVVVREGWGRSKEVDAGEKGAPVVEGGLGDEEKSEGDKGGEVVWEGVGMSVLSSL